MLKKDRVGNVYFVKNIGIDEDTGDEIRTPPMIVVGLRGEISVNLTGESSTTEAGKLVNTFADVPDAPISRFDVVMRKPCGKRRQPAAKICRKRTDNKRAFRRCVGNVKKVRAKRAAAKRKANRRAAARRTRG